MVKKKRKFIEYKYIDNKKKYRQWAILKNSWLNTNVNIGNNDDIAEKIVENE
jgi:hypothetical protein